MNPEGDLLVLEIRDHENHLVSFSAINLETKQLLWDGLTFEESWWLGLTALEKNILLIHEFEDSQNPENQKLFALDVSKQEVLWAVSDFTYLCTEGKQVVGFTREGEERYFSTIDLLNGKISTLGETAARFIQQKAKAKQTNTKTDFPIHYTEENAYFQNFSEFLESKLYIKAVKACDYLEYGNKIIISYYSIEKENLANFIVVFDESGQQLLHEKLDENLEGVGMDTFFRTNDQLIFIKNKTQILSYAI
ncbi:DUF4905 domain-containing protein [Cytophagales bacterium RKSG123]|nr:DUF4905 domain-containing protein [Xanthovirga aplysinae]